MPPDLPRIDPVQQLIDQQRADRGPAAFYASNPPYCVIWGWCNNESARFSTFEEALNWVKGCQQSGGFGRGPVERPTIRNLDRADYNSDGLTDEQREQAEAIGLEVTRP